MRPIHIATAATAFVAGMAGIAYLDRQPPIGDEQVKLSHSLSSLSENILEPTFNQPAKNMGGNIHSKSAQAWKAMLDLPEIFASKEQKEAIKIYLSKPEKTPERQKAYNNVRQLFALEPQLERV